MNDERHQSASADEEDDKMMRLLRLAGPRVSVPDVRAARVRAAVHDRWQAGTRRRAVRQRVVTGTLLLAAAAALVVIASRAIRIDRSPTGIGAVAAVVERIDGRPLRSRVGGAETATIALLPDETVRIGESIETGGAARAALRFTNGTSVRLDRSSRVQLLSASAIELSSGAVYVDTDRGSQRFEVRTVVATARDIGTQFEVRLIDLALRLRVRTGIVELENGPRSVSARGGTEIMFSAAKSITRPFLPHGPEWDWAGALAPPLQIEGVALSTFLEHLAREQGWTLRYGDPELARGAAGIVLHGSVNGLSARDALDVAITTSGLRHRLENGELIVLKR
jgi:ferric-dicitrate binding protein FerR (iron transport regulator)